MCGIEGFSSVARFDGEADEQSAAEGERKEKTALGSDGMSSGQCGECFEAWRNVDARPGAWQRRRASAGTRGRASLTAIRQQALLSPIQSSAKFLFSATSAPFFSGFRIATSKITNLRVVDQG